MNVLSISSDELRAMCSVLAAIYHIGLAGAAKGTSTLVPSTQGQCTLPMFIGRGHGLSTLLSNTAVIMASGIVHLSRSTLPVKMTH